MSKKMYKNDLINLKKCLIKESREGGGWNDSLCGRNYCCSSPFFIKKYFQFILKKDKKKNSFKAMQFLKKSYSNCKDFPYYVKKWNPLDSKKNRHFTIIKFIEFPQLLDDNFLLDNHIISNNNPSINWKSLGNMHQEIEKNKYLQKKIVIFLQKKIKIIKNGTLLKNISTLKEARRILILSQNPLILSLEPINLRIMILFFSLFQHVSKKIYKTFKNWFTTLPINILKIYLFSVQQMVSIVFSQCFISNCEGDGKNESLIIKCLPGFHKGLLERLNGAFIFLNCLRIGILKYYWDKNDFWNFKKVLIDDTEFYNDSLNECLDLRIILHWDVHCSNRGKLNLTKFHWLFDAASKQNVMHNFAKERMNENILMSMFSRDSPFLLLSVHRNNIILDTLRQLQQKDQFDLKKPLKIKFIGEEGVDEGGVKKEYFQILIRELFDTKFGMFIFDKENDYFWFNHNSLEDAQEFELIGMIIGLAIYNNIILDVRFPTILFKKLLNYPLIFEDFKIFDSIMAKGFSQLLKFDGRVEEIFCRTFTHERIFFDTKVIDELKEDGKNINVTKENRKEYVQLYVDYLLNKIVQKQFDMLYQGFHLVAGKDVKKKIFQRNKFHRSDFVKIFAWEELEMLVCGSEDVDFKALEKSARYVDGFTKDSLTVMYFWEVCHNLNQEDKRKLLSFCTGSDRIPIRGLTDLCLTISKNGSDDSLLPTSHTCFNHVLLPDYSEKKILEERILTSIQNSEGFGLM